MENIKKNPLSLQLNAEDFLPASNEEKQSLVVMRESVNFWKDGIRRLKKNKIAMVSFVFIIAIAIFAYLLPAVWPYSYSEQMKGSNNLKPFEYSASEQARIDAGEKVFLLVFDNFRYDQWRLLAKEIGDMFDIDEQLYYSILPTATQYARNAIFSGLMPDGIAKMFPDLWVDEDEEEGKNLNEEPLVRTQIERYRRKDSFSYTKINDSASAEKFMAKFNEIQNKDLNVVVFNFIDILSHARTESKTVRELAKDEKAYRSITMSWFRHSVVYDIFKMLSSSDYRIVVTTDHGSIRVNKPVKIIGERNTNTNLRYKIGRNLGFDAKDLFVIKDPRRVHLPQPNVSTNYVFAQGNQFFAYPNNYNYYVQYYRDTFQHGGISMEEIIIPLVTLKPRKEKWN